ncbi:MAG: succinate dehydrogenase/fumarate reductase iron-sulfur subunit, partial [Anaerolineae bacterium]
ALLEIRDLQDGSLAFRHSCRSGICGSCAVMINSQPKLACQTKLAEVAEDGLIRLEPLASFRVLRDLVVDIDPFLESLKAIVPWLVLRPNHDGRMSPQALAEIEAVGICILCGACEVSETQAGTGLASLARTYRLALDPRDALGPERIKLAADLGLLKWPPYEGFAAECPKGIEFEKGLIPALRALTVQWE